MTTTDTTTPTDVEALAVELAEARIGEARRWADERAASAPHRTEGVRLRYRHLMATYLSMRESTVRGDYGPATIAVGRMVEALGVEAAAILDAELAAEWWPTAWPTA